MNGLEPPVRHEALTYGSYLKVPELLGLQQCLVEGKSHDELLFIIIHQAYELWFKEVLFEIDTILRLLASGQIGEARRLTDRIVTIEKVMVEQIHILETMTPRDFCHFRAALMPASGFQSAQFREIEFVSGLKHANFLSYYPEGSVEHARLTRRLAEPSMRDGLYAALRRLGFDVPPEVDDDEAEFERAALSLLPVYADIERHFDLYHLCEAFVAHDEWLGIWRYHHVRTVERLIGTKQGTGGSPGVKYLQTTLSKRAFPLLWAIRSHLDDHELFAGYKPPTAPG